MRMSEDPRKKYASYSWAPMRKTDEKHVDPLLLSAGLVLQLSKYWCLLETQRYRHFASVDRTSTNFLLQIGGIGGRNRPIVLDDKCREPAPGAYAPDPAQRRGILPSDLRRVHTSTIRDYAQYLLHEDRLELGVLEHARTHRIPEDYQPHFLAGLEHALDRYDLHYRMEFPSSLD